MHDVSCPRCPSEVAVEMTITTDTGVAVDHHHPNPDFTYAFLNEIAASGSAKVEFLLREPVCGLVAGATETVVRDRKIGNE